MYIAVKDNKHLTIMEAEIGHYAGLGYAIHAVKEASAKEKQPKKPAKKPAGEKAP